LQTWLDLTEQLLETGVDSIAIKDMSGILTPMAAYELVSEIKKRYDVRLHLHCHATTGMAEMALLKAIEAGVDGVDTAISSMSATYGHPATEALVATLAGTPMTPDWISTSWKISPPVSARCAKSTTPLKAS
jgi:oxaloacetate decarboxylase alpha subunit